MTPGRLYPGLRTDGSCGVVFDIRPFRLISASRRDSDRAARAFKNGDIMLLPPIAAKLEEVGILGVSNVGTACCVPITGLMKRKQLNYRKGEPIVESVFLSCLDFRLRNQKTPRITSKNSKPPTTPPAIAPTGVATLAAVAVAG